MFDLNKYLKESEKLFKDLNYKRKQYDKFAKVACVLKLRKLNMYYLEKALVIAYIQRDLCNTVIQSCQSNLKGRLTASFIFRKYYSSFSERS